MEQSKIEIKLEEMDAALKLFCKTQVELRDCLLKLIDTNEQSTEAMEKFGITLDKIFEED